MPPNRPSPPSPPPSPPPPRPPGNGDICFNDCGPKGQLNGLYASDGLCDGAPSRAPSGRTLWHATSRPIRPRLLESTLVLLLHVCLNIFTSPSS
eukprot:208276-Pleurochrysis_carterae.AAC.11